MVSKQPAKPWSVPSLWATNAKPLLMDLSSSFLIDPRSISFSTARGGSHGSTCSGDTHVTMASLRIASMVGFMSSPKTLL